MQSQDMKVVVHDTPSVMPAHMYPQLSNNFAQEPTQAPTQAPIQTQIQAQAQAIREYCNCPVGNCQNCVCARNNRPCTVDCHYGLSNLNCKRQATA